MSESSLDQIVKGAPPPHVSVPAVASDLKGGGAVSSDFARALKAPQPPLSPTDPLSNLPSSPPQIYLNLLILEASLRAQYLTLRARRRQHAFVLTLLTVWTAYFGYALFLRPREDGLGVGGSPYWVVDMAEKVALMGGVVTWILIWGTGQWERGVRWPRRWVGVANRGLRGMNCKIVVLKGPWWKELFSHLFFLFPYSSFFVYQGSSYHFIDPVPPEKRSRSSPSDHDVELAEEDVAPGGDHIKLLLLPKPFSRDFRENWELYRTEYWEKENERRSELRKRVRQRERELVKSEGGLLWWTGWRGWKRAGSSRGSLTATSRRPGSSSGLDAHTHHHGLAHQSSLRELRGEKKRRPSFVRDRGRDGSHSRSTSRSSTTAAEGETYAAPQRQRRGSTSTTGSTGDRRRKKTAAAGAGGSSGRVTRLTPADVRPRTPTSAPAGDAAPDLNKRASMLSVASSGTGSDRSVTPGETPPGSPRRSGRRDKALDVAAEGIPQI